MQRCVFKRPKGSERAPATTFVVGVERTKFNKER